MEKIIKSLFQHIRRPEIDSIYEFKKWGDTFTRIAYNPDTDVFVFKRTNKQGKIVCLEVVRPRIKDGVRCYPSSEEFGTYGKCFDYNATDCAKARDILWFGWPSDTEAAKKP